MNRLSRGCRKFFSTSTPLRNDVVRVKKRGPVTMIGLNRPDSKNSLNFELASSLRNALSEAESDGDCGAVLLYGERGNFCQGYDLPEIKDDPTSVERINQIGLTEKFYKIPIVAAVTGFAQGPGFELALWCDFRVVEESAVMGGFSKQLGIPMSDRSACKLTSILGFNKALDWIITGRVVKGKEAFDIGVANRLVAVGSGLGQAYNFACGIANMPRACMRADRASIYLNSEKLSPEVKALLEKERDDMRKLAYEEFNKRKIDIDTLDARKLKSV